MRARRILLYLVLVLCVPLPALALNDGGGDSGDGPASLSVSVSLDRCGLAGAQILCKLDIAYEALPEATSHTVTVTGPNGAVVDYGAIGASPTAIWVPYSGDGHYQVEISAFGEPEGPNSEAKLLDRESAAAGGEDGGSRAQTGQGPRAGGGSHEREPDAGSGAGGEQGGEPPAPTCPELIEAEERAAEADEAELERLEADGLLPDSIECPAADDDAG